MQILDDSWEEVDKIRNQMEQIRRAYNLLRDDSDPEIDEEVAE